MIENGRLFYAKNTGLQRQAPIYVRNGVFDPPEVVLDPNQLSPDGSTSVSQFVPSPDANWLAYAVAKGGADWETVRVRNVATREDLADEVAWVRFSELSWTHDSKGFFYSRYPEPPKHKVLEAALSGQAVYYHRLGTPQSRRSLIYQRTDHPSWIVNATVSDDGRYVFLTTYRGSDNNNQLHFIDLEHAAHAADRRRSSSRSSKRSTRSSRRSATTARASTCAATRTRPIAASSRSISKIRRPSRGKWWCRNRRTRSSTPRVIGGAHRRSPPGGCAEPAAGDSASTAQSSARSRCRRSARSPRSTAAPIVRRVVRVQFAADRRPRSIGMTSTRAAAWHSSRASPPIDPTRFETHAMFATSKDGTRVPFFLTAKKGLTRDGGNPAMLYGYGGFSISLLPGYRADVPAWLELGGIFVTVNLRGGAEYGEAWHKAGYLDRKQNVFDDFIAVAEYLVREKFTSPERLGMMGGSNGGLLVGAVMEQRPDLFAVAMPAVGVMDMLRYDRFTGGKLWATEYGSSSDPLQFAYLIKYSPLHNLKPGTCYPATLVTTADHDDRVVPSHSFKFTAALQEAQGCDRPALIRVEVDGSHGYRPTDRLIAERADQWSFAAAHLKLEPS